MHKRIDIRKYILSNLKLNNIVDVGGRIYMSRVRPEFLTELPCTCVYFVSEPADHQKSGPRIYQRELVIHVDTIYQEDSPEVDNFLDARAYEIEAVMLKDREMGGLVHEVNLTETRPVNVNYEGENRYAAIRQVFTVEYETEIPIDTNSFNEFLSYTADWRTKDGIELANDIVTIREE